MEYRDARKLYIKALKVRKPSDALRGARNELIKAVAADDKKGMQVWGARVMKELWNPPLDKQGEV